MYPSVTGMRKEEYCRGAQEISGDGWLPDDYQIAEDLLLMIVTEARSEENPTTWHACAD
jgi:hypothetical protein